MNHGRKYGEKDSYPICIWNGIFDHYGKIGPAIWEFVWCIDKITKESQGIGSVLGGAPVKVARIAADFGRCEKSVRLHLGRLKKHGYIGTRKTPFGLVISVMNSRKIRPAESGNLLPDPERGRKEITGGSGKNLPQSPVRTYRSKEDKAVDKAVDEAVAGTAPTPNSPWKALGSDLPMGSPKFQKIAEHYFATRNGNTLSDAMERAIQTANKRGVGVPPKFFEAKRMVEKQEESIVPIEVPAMKDEPWEM